MGPFAPTQGPAPENLSGCGSSLGPAHPCPARSSVELARGEVGVLTAHCARRDLGEYPEP